MTKNANKSKKKSKFSGWLLSALIVLGGPAYVFRHSLLPSDHTETMPGAPAEETPMSVSVVAAELMEISRIFQAFGTLVPREEIVIVPKVTGVAVFEILAEIGDSVEKGQLLARLKNSRMPILLAQQAADLAGAEASISQGIALVDEAKATLDEARIKLERTEVLTKRNAIAATALEAHKGSVATAKARYQAQQQALVAARADLRRVETEREDLLWQQNQLEIRTAYAGLITEVTAQVGQTTGGDGSPLFRIMKDGEIELEATVVEMVLPTIKIGQKVKVAMSDGNQTVNGQVRRVAPTVDATTRMGKVWISLSGTGLRSGGSARAFFETERQQAIVVPHMAVIQGETGPRVLTLQDDIVRYRSVETGLNAATGIQITSGLEPGEIVVAVAGGFLREGSAVTPVPFDALTSKGDF